MKIRQGKFTGNKFKAYGWQKYALSIGNIEWKRKKLLNMRYIGKKFSN